MSKKTSQKNKKEDQPIIGYVAFTDENGLLQVFSFLKEADFHWMIMQLNMEGVNYVAGCELSQVKLLRQVREGEKKHENILIN